MPDQSSIDAFMADLLNDLGDGALSSPSASGSFQKPAATPTLIRHSAHKRRKVSQSTPIHASSPLAQPPSSRSGATTAADRPGIPPTPAPFWSVIDKEDRIPRVPGSQRRGARHAADENGNGHDAVEATPTRGRQVGAKRSKSPLLDANPKAAFGTSPPRKRPVKHVEVGFEAIARKERLTLGQKSVNARAAPAVPEIRLEPPAPPVPDSDYFDDDFTFDENALEATFRLEAAKAKKAVSFPSEEESSRTSYLSS